MGYENQPSLDDDLNLIVSELAVIYKGHFSMPSVGTIHNILARANKYYSVCILALGVFSVLCAAVIVFSYKPKIEPFMYLTCSFAGAFLMTLALPLYLRLANVVGKVNITGKAMYSLVVTYGNGVIDAVLAASAVMALLTVVFAILFKLRLKKD